MIDENGEIRHNEVERDGNKRGVWSSEKSQKWRMGEGIFPGIPYTARLRCWRQNGPLRGSSVSWWKLWYNVHNHFP